MQIIAVIHMLPCLVHEKVVLINVYLHTRCATVEIQESLGTMLLAEYETTVLTMDCMRIRQTCIIFGSPLR